MSQITRTALKLFFETGDVPTEAQFADFIDSCLNFSTDNVSNANSNIAIGVAAPIGTRLTAKGQDNLSTSFAFKATDNSDAPILVARDDGRVGILTAAPLHAHHVVGTSYTTSMLSVGIQTSPAEVGTFKYGNGTGKTRVLIEQLGTSANDRPSWRVNGNGGQMLGEVFQPANTFVSADWRDSGVLYNNTDDMPMYLSVATGGTDGKIHISGHTSSGGTVNTLATFDAKAQRVGIGVDPPLAKLDVDQSDVAGAIPVLKLDQADLSEELIQFESTIGVGNPIEAVGAKTLTTTHFLKVTLPGALTRYIPAGTIA